MTAFIFLWNVAIIMSSKEGNNVFRPHLLMLPNVFARSTKAMKKDVPCLNFFKKCLSVKMVSLVDRPALKPNHHSGRIDTASASG